MDRTHIGAYRIKGVIGQGGMGTVYEAEHTKILHRAAIKVLKPELAAQPEILARFFNEARAVNLIKHPSIVQIHDYGTLEDDSAYLVMEYLEGVSLSARIKQLVQPMREPEVIRLGWQLASALAAAHERDIVHRDLKPANAMIVPDPVMLGGERVKLLDFGIAKLGEQAANTDIPSTQTGMMLGTPRYMSPEQCRANAAIDGKSDVYSLGVMLYELLSGQPLFKGTLTPLNWACAHTMDAPEPLQSWVPQVSDALAGLVHRMLEKAKEHRPSMHEVAQQLDELGGNPPLPPRLQPTVPLRIAHVPKGINRLQPAQMPMRESLPVDVQTESADQIPTVALRSSSHTTIQGNRLGLTIRSLPRKQWGIAVASGALLILGLSIAVGFQRCAAPTPRMAQNPSLLPDPAPVLARPRVETTALLPLPSEVAELGPAEFSIGRSGEARSADSPNHIVSIPHFAMGRYEISLEDYRHFVESNQLSGHMPWDGLEPFEKYKDLPVNAISRDQAARYCQWRYTNEGRVGRLPTEAEWEYAARSGQLGFLYPWGTDKPTRERVNAEGGKNIELLPVGSFRGGRSSQDVYNLLGNIAEWTESNGAPYPGSQAVIQKGMAVVRGGDAMTPLRQLSVAARRFVPPDRRDAFIGFRCAISLPN